MITSYTVMFASICTGIAAISAGISAWATLSIKNAMLQMRVEMTECKLDAYKKFALKDL